MDIETLRVIISGDVSGLSGAVVSAEKELTGLQKAQMSVGAAAQKAGKLIAAYGVATTAALVKAAKEAGQLNKELANIGTLSVPTERLKEFKGQIQDIAIATGKNTSDISEGTYQIISAFGDASDTMEKVEINAKAARAGLATTADSINLTSAVTKAYGDTSAAAVQKVADLAFKTVELGQTTFPELAQSMQQVTSESKELGVSQEELFATYATLTGVTGNAAEVQTQLKAIYTALLKPSDKMTNVIKKLGYNSGYAMINSLGLAGTLDALTKATDGSKEALLDLFVNQRAIPAALALTGAQADIFTQKLGKMEEASGAASRAFEVQTEGIAKTGFTLEQAQVKMQVATQRFGEAAAPIIGDFANLVDNAATALSNMSDEQLAFIANTGKTAAALTVLGAVVPKIYNVIKGIKSLASGVGELAKGAGSAGLAAPILGMVGGAGLVFGFLDHVKKSIEETKYAQTHFGEEVAKQTEKLKASGAALKDAREHIEEYKSTLSKLNSGTLNNKDAEAAREQLKEIATYFNQKYGLELNVDSTEVQDATANLEAMLEAVEKAKKETGKNRRDLFHDLTSDETVDNYRKSWSNEANQKEIRDYNNGLVKTYETAHSIIQDWRDEYDELKITGKATGEELEKVNQKYREKLKAEAPGVRIPVDNNNFEGAIKEAERYIDDYKKLADEAQENIDNILKARGEYQNGTSEFLAQTNTEIKAAAKQGKDYSQYLSQIGNLINRMGLNSKYDAFGNEKNMSQLQQDKQDIAAFAQATAAAQNGFDSFQESVVKGGAALQNTTTNAVQNMMDWGVSAKDAGNQIFNSLKQSGVSAQDAVNMVQQAFDSLGLKDYKVELSAEGTIKIIPNTEEVDNYKPEEKPGTAKYTVDKSAVDAWTPPTKVGTVNYHAVIGDGSSLFNKLPNAWSREATGTDYFPGGLAMVNDQRGIADPRELIVDRGRAFIPEGRDVILPLSKGAKVYTAAETKRILAGIPHYAGGKDNSDAFTSARDDWQHYTRTHAVTTAQELEKWLEFQEKYKENEKDIWDIEEQVFSLRQKQYSEQTRASEQWLAHETKYNGLAYSEQLDAIDRIRQNTVAAYEAGIISHKEYLDTIAKYDEEYIDTRKEQIAEMFDVSKAYISERTYLNDWADNGDDPLEAYNRVKQDRLNELNAKELTQKEYDEYMKSLGSDMFQGRLEQSYGWLDEQSKYFDLSDEDYIKGLQRMQEYTQKYLDEGIIGRVEYHKAMTEFNHQIWDKQEEILNEGLEKQREEIDKIKQQFQDEEQALRDSWAVDDRRESIADLTEKVRLWQGAVTERGQEQLKQYQEQLKQAQREEELYQLQVKNNATIEEMEKQYKLAEDNKKVLLRGIRSEVVDAQEAVNTLVDSVENPKESNKFVKLLEDIETAINNLEIKVNNYNDNRKQTTINNTRSPDVGEIAHGYFPYAVSR